jgi:CRISPR-associated exonuclease Cas4
MAFSEVALAALIAVVLCLVLFRWIRRIQRVAAERAWRPLELQEADLVYAERTFRARTPLRLVARVDRGYRRADGSIVLVELKTRSTSQAYFSDVIELSAQRLAVEAQGNRVSEYAYVVTQSPGSRKKRIHLVKLLSGNEVIGLANRREFILTSVQNAGYALERGLCRGCSFSGRCQPHRRADR